MNRQQLWVVPGTVVRAMRRREAASLFKCNVILFIVFFFWSKGFVFKCLVANANEVYSMFFVFIFHFFPLSQGV